MYEVAKMADNIELGELVGPSLAELKQAEEFNLMEYSEFVKTDYWRLVREAVIEVRGGQCAVCENTKSLIVHHRSYRNHGMEHRHLEDLVVLCWDCHSKIHADKAKPKKDPEIKVKEWRKTSWVQAYE
jgi:5-methylcytosine-specific restriction endonuclease McrA